MLSTEWKCTQPLDEQFLQLPFQVYRNDRHWLGEDSQSIRAAFSDQNDFFENGKAWVGCSDQCRLAGFIEEESVIGGKKCAYFGFWESQNDLEENQRLFSQFEEWARSQGVEVVFGPINFNTYGLNRLRLDGFEQPAFLGEPYNPFYYPEILQSLGYTVCYRYQSRFHSAPEVWAEEMMPYYLEQKQRLNSQFKVEALSQAVWMQNLDELYQVIDVAFQDNFAYRPISKSLFKQGFGKDFIEKSCPNTSNIMFDSENRIAGFFIAFPDYAPLLHDIEDKSKTAILNFDSCQSDLPKPRSLLAKTGAVHPRHRNSGIFTWMANEILMRSQGRYEHICSALIREDNHSLKYAMRCPEYRTYGLFSKTL